MLQSPLQGQVVLSTLRQVFVHADDIPVENVMLLSSTFLRLCAAKASAYRKTNQAKARRYGRVSLKASIAGLVIGVVILAITVYRVANLYNRRHKFTY